jgi:hypothetical protein
LEELRNTEKTLSQEAGSRQLTEPSRIQANGGIATPTCAVDTVTRTSLEEVRVEVKGRIQLFQDSAMEVVRETVTKFKVIGLGFPFQGRIKGCGTLRAKRRRNYWDLYPRK